MIVFTAPDINKVEPLSLAEEWVYRVWQHGDIAYMQELCAENYTDYTVPDSEAGDCAAFVESVRQVRVAFPDLKAEVLDSFEDEDYVILRILFTGTHQSDYLDFAPTNQRIEWQSIDILHFGETVLLERWSQNDLLSELQNTIEDFGELQRETTQAELIGQLAEIPRAVREAIRTNGIHAARGDEWSTQATLGYLWRVERQAWQAYLQQLANQEQPYLASFDGARYDWEREFGESDVNVLLDAYEFLRNATCAYLRELNQQDWARRGVHREFGEVDVAGLMQNALEHDYQSLANLAGAQL